MTERVRMRRSDGRFLYGHTPQAPRAMYVTGGGRDVALCCWPGCERYATREVKWGPAPDCKPLCPKHRDAYDGLKMGELERMPWQPKRRVKIVQPGEVDRNLVGKRRAT